MNSRSKGKRGELEWAKWLHDNLGLSARRGQQRSGVDCQDVIDGIPGTWAEVKRVERLNVDLAMAQAVRDAGERYASEIPYVAHRRNRGEWLVTVRARDLDKFASVLFHRGMSQTVLPPSDRDPRGFARACSCNVDGCFYCDAAKARGL